MRSLLDRHPVPHLEVLLPCPLVLQLLHQSAVLDQVVLLVVVLLESLRRLQRGHSRTFLLRFRGDLGVLEGVANFSVDVETVAAGVHVQVLEVAALVVTL